MKELTKFHTWTAVITPFDEKLNVDYPILENLLRAQDEAGNGVVLLGSTAEALNLSSKDKKEILNFASKLELKTPIVLGVGGHQLEETLEWVKFSEDQKIDGLLLVTPIYAKPGALGQTLWFETLMNATSRPCMLYNVPGRSACELNFDAVKTLREHPRFWSIKEASGSTEKFSKYRQLLPDHALYSGDDAMLPFFSTIGCEGVVSVASNVWAKETNLYAKLCLEGKFETLFPLWEKACSALFLASNPVPAKALLHHKGQIKTPLVKAPLHHEDFKHLEHLHQLDIRINAWYEENK